MEIFPIIYSRNYYMDYSPRFYLCPENINDEILKKIRKCVLDVIKYSNMITNQRRIIISENGCTILGIVCDLKKYVNSNFEATEEYDKFTEDNKGRSVVCFLGILFKNCDLEKDNIIIDFEQIIRKLYIQYIANEKMWFDDSVNHHESTPIEVEVNVYQHKAINGKKVKCFGREIYECSDDLDKDLFMKIMALCGGREKKYYFCSDYYGIESIKNSQFQILTSKYISKIEKMSIANDKLVMESKKNNVIQKKRQLLIICGIILAIMAMIIIVENGRKII